MSAEPVKETPAAETAAPAPETVPEVKPETTTETTAPATTEAPKEEKVSSDAVKVEAQPIAAGNLGYKAPGLLKYVYQNGVLPLLKPPTQVSSVFSKILLVRR